MPVFLFVCLSAGQLSPKQKTQSIEKLERKYEGWRPEIKNVDEEGEKEIDYLTISFAGVHLETISLPPLSLTNSLSKYIVYIYIYIYIYHYQVLLIAQSSLTICPNRPSLPANPLDSIQYPHRADVCKSLLVNLHCRIHHLDLRNWLRPSAADAILT